MPLEVGLLCACLGPFSWMETKHFFLLSLSFSVPLQIINTPEKKNTLGGGAFFLFPLFSADKVLADCMRQIMTPKGGVGGGQWGKGGLFIGGLIV